MVLAQYETKNTNKIYFYIIAQKVIKYGGCIFVKVWRSPCVSGFSVFFPLEVF